MGEFAGALKEDGQGKYFYRVLGVKGLVLPRFSPMEEIDEVMKRVKGLERTRLSFFPHKVEEIRIFSVLIRDMGDD